MVEKIERILDTTVKKADQVKAQTATALEDAARKLREVDISAKSEDVKRILIFLREHHSNIIVPSGQYCNHEQYGHIKGKNPKIIRCIDTCKYRRNCNRYCLGDGCTGHQGENISAKTAFG